MRVRFTDSARAQFLAGLAHIHRDKPSAAVRLRRRAEVVLRRPAKFPESGRIIPEFPDLPFREVLISPSRFFYRVKGKTVWIVAVWHSARLPEKSVE